MYNNIDLDNFLVESHKFLSDEDLQDKKNLEWFDNMMTECFSTEMNESEWIDYLEKVEAQYKKNNPYLFEDVYSEGKYWGISPFDWLKVNGHWFWQNPNGGKGLLGKIFSPIKWLMLALAGSLGLLLAGIYKLLKEGKKQLAILRIKKWLYKLFMLADKGIKQPRKNKTSLFLIARQSRRDILEIGCKLTQRAGMGSKLQHNTNQPANPVESEGNENNPSTPMGTEVHESVEDIMTNVLFEGLFGAAQDFGSKINPELRSTVTGPEHTDTGKSQFFNDINLPDTTRIDWSLLTPMQTSSWFGLKHKNVNFWSEIRSVNNDFVTSNMTKWINDPNRSFDTASKITAHDSVYQNDQYVTDANGKPITDAFGKPVTKRTKLNQEQIKSNATVAYKYASLLLQAMVQSVSYVIGTSQSGTLGKAGTAYIQNIISQYAQAENAGNEVKHNTGELLKQKQELLKQRQQQEQENKNTINNLNNASESWYDSFKEHLFEADQVNQAADSFADSYEYRKMRYGANPSDSNWYRDMRDARRDEEYQRQVEKDSANAIAQNRAFPEICLNLFHTVINSEYNNTKMGQMVMQSMNIFIENLQKTTTRIIDSVAKPARENLAATQGRDAASMMMGRLLSDKGDPNQNASLHNIANIGFDYLNKRKEMWCETVFNSPEYIWWAMITLCTIPMCIEKALTGSIRSFSYSSYGDFQNMIAKYNKYSHEVERVDELIKLINDRIAGQELVIKDLQQKKNLQSKEDLYNKLKAIADNQGKTPEELINDVEGIISVKNNVNVRNSKGTPIADIEPVKINKSSENEPIAEPANNTTEATQKPSIFIINDGKSVNWHAYSDPVEALRHNPYIIIQLDEESSDDTTTHYYYKILPAANKIIINDNVIGALEYFYKTNQNTKVKAGKYVISNQAKYDSIIDAHIDLSTGDVNIDAPVADNIKPEIFFNGLDILNGTTSKPVETTQDTTTKL